MTNHSCNLLEILLKNGPKVKLCVPVILFFFFELHSILEGQEGLLFIQRNSNICRQQKKVKGNKIEDKRKTNEKRIAYLVSRMSGDIRERSNTVSQTWRVGHRY